MGKRALVAFSLSLLVIMGYQYVVARKYPPPPQDAAVEQRGMPGGQEREPFAVQRQTGEEKVFSAAETKTGKDVVVETDLLKLVITSNGARIKSCQLKEYPEEKLDIANVRKQIEGIALAEANASAEKKESLRRQKNKQQLLLERLEQCPKMAELVSLSAAVDGDFSPAIIFPEREKDSFSLNTAVYRCSRDALSLSKGQSAGQLEFTYADSRGRKVTKVYSFSNSSYIIGVDIIFHGWKEKDLPGGRFVLLNGPDVGMPQPAQRGRRGLGYKGPVSCFQSRQQNWVQREKYGRNESDIFVQREHKRQFELKGQSALRKILWAGLENKYFLSALIPSREVDAVLVEKNTVGEQKVGLSVPWQGPGAYNFRLYLGPKKRETLKAVGATLEKSIDYGFFGAIGRFIYRILVFFSNWTNNFGWAIVLLCLAVKIVFYPFTHHSFEAMQKMQQQMKSIQPEMDDLRGKFKDNPQKLNKEMMELYKRKGVNPLASCQSGCLPLLLQMPVFFALYSVLYNSIELRGAPFIGWITDLSAKDPYYILPVLMGVSMFAQQKLTGMGAASGSQQDQAKMMSWLMPVFLTWIFASLPSGVVLYWFTFNVVTAGQQLLIKKKQAAAVVV
jgi:YidC/Oxa1 family membrane protein insertase